LFTILEYFDSSDVQNLKVRFGYRGLWYSVVWCGVVGSVFGWYLCSW